MWTNMSRVGALWRLCFPAATGSNRLEWIMSIFIVIVSLSEHGQRLHRIGPLYRPGLLLPLGYTSNDNNETWCKYHNTRFRKYQLVWQLSYFKLSVGIIWKLGFQMCFCNHWNLSCWKKYIGVSENCQTLRMKCLNLYLVCSISSEIIYWNCSR